MLKNGLIEKHKNLFQTVSKEFGVEAEEIRNAIDVAFVETFFGKCLWIVQRNIEKSSRKILRGYMSGFMVVHQSNNAVNFAATLSAHPDALKLVDYFCVMEMRNG